MNRRLTSLNVINVASPCPANWDEMTGDDRVRHCSQCNLDVYNLSEMTERDALKLVNERQGRLCAQFYRRADGTIITRDCPVGLRAIRQKIVGMWAKAVALSGALCVTGLFARSAQAEKTAIDAQPAPIPVEAALIKGDICITPQVSLTYESLKMLPAATLKEYLSKCLAKEEQAAYGMPDPDNKAVLAESIRQELQKKVDDAQFLPAPGTKQHDDLAKLTAELLKQHGDVALQIMAPQLHIPVPVHEVLGRIMVAPDLPIELLAPR